MSLYFFGLYPNYVLLLIQSELKRPVAVFLRLKGFPWKSWNCCTVGLLLRNHQRVSFFLFCWMFQVLGCCKGIGEIQNRLDSLHNYQAGRLSIFMVLFWDAYSSEMSVTSTNVLWFVRTDAQCLLCSITYFEKKENCLCVILFILSYVSWQLTYICPRRALFLDRTTLASANDIHPCLQNN